MKRGWMGLALGVALLAGLLAFRAARYGRHDARPDIGIGLKPAFDQGALAQRLAGALRIPTVSDAETPTRNDDNLRALRAYLANTYPLVHARLGCEVIAGNSLLFTWRGSDPALAPAALLAHLDVVPAETDAWRVPPFEGRIQDGFIWGRGSLDDKVAVLGILEAATALLQQDFRPRRTLIFAFGQDEETGGHAGAAALAALLKSRGVKLDSVLDEGEVVGEGLVPGVTKPVAFIGTAEKGYLSLGLRATGPGGHSSMPGGADATVHLLRALAKLEARPFPARFTEPVDGMFRALAPEMGPIQRLALANRWLSGPLLEHQLAASPATNALLRTTMSVTRLEAGIRDNVIPGEAQALVNLRLLPGDTVVSATARVRQGIDDPAVSITPDAASALEASSVSPSEDPAFRAIASAIHAAFPDALVAPSLVLGGTDSAHYGALARTTYRFLPVRVGPEDLERFHGRDERLAVKNYAEAVRFYAAYLQTAGAP
ncbi:MAG TPA: M20/M25/M40 family metallo-hydrolase [Holophagaceae bacterium]|nr:M20/M25/M40 family metallo-hydrolase [Holophagaceae bacterium]